MSGIDLSQLRAAAESQQQMTVALRVEVASKIFAELVAREWAMEDASGTKLTPAGRFGQGRMLAAVSMLNADCLLEAAGLLRISPKTNGEAQP